MSDRQFQLVMRKGPQPGKIYPLLIDSITIGRDPMADISINDPEVSRQHARLTRNEDGGYTLEDLNSTNGTFIEGEKLAGNVPTRLHASQIIDMGSGVTLLFESLHAVEDPAPEPPQEIEINPFTAVPPLDAEADMVETPVPAFAEEPEDEPMDVDVEPAPPAPEPVRTAVQPPPPRPPRRTAPIAPPQTPLVVSENSKDPAKRRRNVMLTVVGLLVLCCLCLLFFLSAYFYWGDPLMRSLGIY